jgi:hypothetical protein
MPIEAWKSLSPVLFRSRSPTLASERLLNDSPRIGMPMLSSGFREKCSVWLNSLIETFIELKVGANSVSRNEDWKEQ